MPPKIEVSIPVNVGGNTGQRDQFESMTHQYAVSVAGPTVTLERTGFNSAAAKKISFSLDDLAEAVQFVRSRNPDNPVRD